MLDAVDAYYREANANVHRGAHYLAAKATERSRTPSQGGLNRLPLVESTATQRQSKLRFEHLLCFSFMVAF